LVTNGGLIRPGGFGRKTRTQRKKWVVAAKGETFLKRGATFPRAGTWTLRIFDPGPRGKFQGGWAFGLQRPSKLVGFF